MSMSAPKGLTYIDNFLSVETAAQLLEELDRLPWDGDGKQHRRVQQYGVQYDYKTHQVCFDVEPTPFPEAVKPIIEMLETAYPSIAPIAQLFVNEYIHHQGIGPHIDHPTHFGPVISILTLGDAVPLIFSKDDHKQERYVQLLNPQSLTLVTGESRYEWQHEIPYSKLVRWTDAEGNTHRFKRHNTFRRVSLTFRSIVNKP